MIKSVDLLLLRSDPVRRRENPLAGWPEQERLEGGRPGHGAPPEPGNRSPKGHSEGLLGLVDQRLLRPNALLGRADDRVVAAIRAELDAQTDTSTGTRGRLMRRVTARLTADHGPDTVPIPARSTFYALVNVLATGRHSFGAATTRRSLANRPHGTFAPSFALRPGEIVQIDSTPLDVMTVLDDGSWVARN